MGHSISSKFIDDDNNTNVISIQLYQYHFVIYVSCFSLTFLLLPLGLPRRWLLHALHRSAARSISAALYGRYNTLGVGISGRSARSTIGHRLSGIGYRVLGIGYWVLGIG